MSDTPTVISNYKNCTSMIYMVPCHVVISCICDTIIRDMEDNWQHNVQYNGWFQLYHR